MKNALQNMKQQIKDMMHQSESLPEIKALLRLSDEIDNVLQILPDKRPAAVSAASGNTGSNRSVASAKTSATRNKTAAKPASSSNASAEPAPATTKMPAPTPAGKPTKKEPFIDPGDR